MPDAIHRHQCVVAPPTTVSPANANNGQLEVYRITATQAGSPTRYGYIDAMGRTLRTKSFGFNGEAIESHLTHHRSGYVTQFSSPAGTVTYDKFDALGRPTEKVVDQYPQQFKTNYSYQGLTTTATITPQGSHGNTSTKNPVPHHQQCRASGHQH